MSPGAYLLQADARSIPLRDASVQCVVTSPPYWGLRDYGIAGQIGLERTPEDYVAHLVAVFREVRRVLRDDGTVWLNLGDSYATGAGRAFSPGGGEQGERFRAMGAQVPDSKNPQSGIPVYQPNRMPIDGLKPKDLVGIPWRVAFALQADGWWLRSDIIWAKPNPMPESITDRPTKAHEYVFLLTKAERYYYDHLAVAERCQTDESRWDPGTNGLGGADRKTGKSTRRYASGNKERRLEVPTRPNDHRGSSIPWEAPATLTRNRRTVWTIATDPYPEAHFATFPEKLVEPCVLAGPSERGACPTCGAAWVRIVERSTEKSDRDARGKALTSPRHDGSMWNENNGRGFMPVRTKEQGWSPACDCPSAEPVPCRVLDPFAGSGMTVAVAERLGRVGIGLELKPDYLTLARKRTAQAGLL